MRAPGLARRPRPSSRLGTLAIALVLALGMLAGAAQVRAADSGFTDIAGNPFEADIEWLFDEGITTGCHLPETAPRFCPTDPVSREQMASFLVRALDLPPATQDYFLDDEASTLHEDDINRVREAKITLGCNDGGTLFCPSGPVLREQMASFLMRAMRWYWQGCSGVGSCGVFKMVRYEPMTWPLAEVNPFDDDDASDHELDIDELAATGVTLGCGQRLFCPGQVVTREQMAAFLHRAVTSFDALPRSPDVVELGVYRILGLTRDFAVAESQENSVEYSAFTYRLTPHPLGRTLQNLTPTAYRSITSYSVQTLSGIAVEYPLWQPCNVAIDATTGSAGVGINFDLAFQQTPGGPVSSTRLVVTALNSIGWSWEDGDFTGSGACAMPDVRGHIVDLLTASIGASLLIETELCRGDDTALFAPCPVTP